MKYFKKQFTNVKSYFIQENYCYSSNKYFITPSDCKKVRNGQMVARVSKCLCMYTENACMYTHYLCMCVSVCARIHVCFSVSVCFHMRVYVIVFACMRVGARTVGARMGVVRRGTKKGSDFAVRSQSQMIMRDRESVSE